MKRPLYQHLASRVQARINCEKSDNREWLHKHRESANKLVSECLPSGSGWDNGTKLDWDASKPDKLVLYGSFHHMDKHGGYSGWTDHSIIVTPSLVHGIEVRVTGRDRNETKEYLGDMFDHALRAEIDDAAILTPYVESEAE